MVLDSVLNQLLPIFITSHYFCKFVFSVIFYQSFFFPPSEYPYKNSVYFILCTVLAALIAPKEHCNFLFFYTNLPTCSGMLIMSRN
jgi:hypothetical protein